MARIIVLEDDRDLNRSVCTFLTMKNHEAEGFLSASQALEAMEKRKYDVVITDVMMKEMDGFEFASSIRDVSIASLFGSTPEKMAGVYRFGLRLFNCS